jgi:glucose/mannose-6-phosphate isomerase
VSGELTAAAVAAVDSTGQAAEMLSLGEHLTDALWRFDSAGIAPVDAPGGLIVAGMGGSAVGGRLALGLLEPQLKRPMAISDGYGLPGWAGPDTLVLCSSYSGSTEETLAAYDAAAERGAPRLVATTGGALGERARRDGVPVIPIPGGFQPRATVGYSLVAAVEAAALCGAAPSLRGEIESAAALARELAAEWGPNGADDNEAKALARRLEGTVPVIAGAEQSFAAAYRWKSQINENAGLPAFASPMPELCHNEIVGWPAARSLGRFSAVFLDDTGNHPRNALRTELVAQQAAEWADVVERVQPRGGSKVSSLIALVLLGDLVSLYLAVLRGKDPSDVAPIAALKAALAER